MSLSIGARPGMNNPGDLTVSRSNPNLYATSGQTGVYASPNGLSYPIFVNVQDGWNALIEWIQSNVGSNPNNSLTTPSELASYYLNGTFGPLVSNPLNPYPQTWLRSLESALGISGQDNASLSQFTPQQIGTAIEHAEGTFGTFGPVNSGTGMGVNQTVVTNGPFNSSVNATIQNEVNAGVSPFGIGATALADDPWGALGQIAGIFAGPDGSVTPQSIAGGATQIIGNGVQNTAGTGANQIGAAVGAGVSSAITPLTSWLGGLTSSNTISRVTVGIVAVILLGAGIFFLASGNKTTVINVASLRGAV